MHFFFFVLHVFVFFSLVLSSSGQSSIKRLFVFRIVLGIITKKNILEHLEELKQHTEPLVTSPLHMWPPPRHAHTHKHTLSLARSVTPLSQATALRQSAWRSVQWGTLYERVRPSAAPLWLGARLSVGLVWIQLWWQTDAFRSRLHHWGALRLFCPVWRAFFIFISLVCIFIFISLECIWFCNAGVEYLELPVSLDRCSIRNHPWRVSHFICMQIPRKEILTMVSMEMLKRTFKGRSTDI